MKSVKVTKERTCKKDMEHTQSSKIFSSEEGKVEEISY